MELDTRHYARYNLTDDALETWRKHACLPRLSLAQRRAAYAAAVPLLAAAANALVQHHAWRPAPTDPAELFNIRHPSSDTPFLALPLSLDALFAHAAPCMRMFEGVFAVHLDPSDGRLSVAQPLTDIFHLLQLLVPGCFALVRAEYVTHEVDDEGEVGCITWLTHSYALPPTTWMNLHTQQSPQLVAVFGETRWAALRRASTDSEVLSSSDITFA